jgi:hypothetical protein
MYAHLIRLAKSLWQKATGFYTSSWRITFVSVFVFWILFNLIQTKLTDFWYGLNFKEPWTSADYPPLCTDRTARLLPWMTAAYLPLNSPQSNIRLLHIHPSHSIWGIEATLESRSFLERPQYRALSYHWGYSEKTRPITLNGKKMLVGENLWNALFHIRDTRVMRTFWVDAISIDQTNNSEKSVQVHLMSFIYSRAKEVIMWMGDHRAPRWIDQEHSLQWQKDFAVSKANDDWTVTKYWLYLLTQEEYWKRCWIVQEVAMASKIRVMSGQSSLPWADFIQLMKLYKSKVPLDSYSIDYVLKLEALREAKYIDGNAYTLEHLLDQFGDCFCAVTLDKIFAFVGMASDCLEGCVEVDYSKSLLSAYQELLIFWTAHAPYTPDQLVHIPRFAGLVRAILSRQSVLVPKIVTPPRNGENADSLLYLLCSDDRSEYCNLIPKLQSLLGWVDLVKRLSDRTISYFFNHKVELRSMWLASEPESHRIWVAKSPIEIEANKALMYVRGRVAGRVCDLGPTYREFIERAHVPKQWAARLGTIWGVSCNETTRRIVTTLNERLTMLLGAAADHRMRNFVSLDEDTPYSFYSSRLFIAFGPDREVILGLAPWETLRGDIIVQFWNTNAVLVAREMPNETPAVIGRAGVVKDGKAMDWDAPRKKSSFEPPTATVFDHSLTLSSLTRLSLDTVCLPGHSLHIYGESWGASEHGWTSHDFEMNDVRLFAGSEKSYDNHWDSDLIDGIEEVKHPGQDSLKESCFSNPCRIYKRARTKNWLEVGQPLGRLEIEV